MQQAVFTTTMILQVAAEGFRCRGERPAGYLCRAIREQVDAMQHLRLGGRVPVALGTRPF